jgi:hypothetical protein
MIWSLEPVGDVRPRAHCPSQRSESCHVGLGGVLLHFEFVKPIGSLRQAQVTRFLCWTNNTFTGGAV